MKTALLLLILLCGPFAFGASVDTVSIYSAAMGNSRKCVVVKPDAYQKGKARFPAVYLLHGYGGSYRDWISRVPALRQYADRYGMLIVCPDGGASSWYLDSPIDSSMRFETYIGREVPAYIDRHYRTIADRRGRAIAGLSMGGHGSLFIAFRQSETFGACGSMSGGVNLYASRNRYDISKRIGDTVHYAGNWKRYSALYFVEAAPAQPLAIMIDCGREDPFFRDHILLHERLVSLGVPHEYVERPGGHSWDYWSHALPYQLVFFHQHFSKKAP